MNFVLDIGNTRIKAAVFNNSELIQEYAAERSEIDINNILGSYKGEIKRCIISSVAGVPEEIPSLLKAHAIPTLFLTPHTQLPFQVNYETPNSLGQDRVAAIAGACYLYPSENVLVIDAGTAITFDLKTQEGIYLGGNISPGLSLRFKVLHEATANLPLLSQQSIDNELGKSTSSAITNGVQNGLIHEVNGYIEDLGNKYPELIVILTGGDSHFFDNKLKKPIFVVSNLTVLGLNFILRYNAEKY